MKLIVMCLPGVEACVKRELISLGFDNLRAENGRFEVFGDLTMLSRLCLWLRCADRVLIEIADFSAKSFDELFENASKVDFSRYLKINTKVRLNGNCYNSKLMAIKSSGGVIKKAIMNNLFEKYNTTVETGDTVTIYFDIISDRCKLYIDACGDGLHKRGYRIKTYSAPLKETLAAAIIDLSLFPIKNSMVDLFCGSGTLAIEAAMRAKNIAPGINRHFDFEKLAFFDGNILQKEREIAKAQVKDTPVKILASDINPEAISLAKENARNAGVEKFIEFKVQDALEFTSSEEYGVLISNPPYGDRLLTKKEVYKLYSEFSKTLKKLKNWSYFIITDISDFEKIIKRTPDKKRKLYNAKLECTLYSYYGKKPQ